MERIFAWSVLILLTTGLTRAERISPSGSLSEPSTIRREPALICKWCCIIRGSALYGTPTNGPYQNLCANLVCADCNGTDCANEAAVLPTPMPDVLQCGDIESYVEQQ